MQGVTVSLQRCTLTNVAVSGSDDLTSQTRSERHATPATVLKSAMIARNQALMCHGGQSSSSTTR
jgi:hypothetical protein